MTVSEFLNNSKLKKIDSQILLKHVLEFSTSDIIMYPNKILSKTEEEVLTQLSTKRISGTPVEYLVGEKAFFKDVFHVCEGVLIPQPDTEILVEEAIKLAHLSNNDSFKILDLCSGSGCIGISVAKEIHNQFDSFEVVFSDISPVAIECCKRNAQNLLHGINYRIVQGDLFENLKAEQFDMILTNPPYIPSDVIPTLDVEVQHEPALALDGGKSGLFIIERILSDLHLVLKKNGCILMEIGYDQGSSVSDLFKAANLADVKVIKDLGTRDRVVKARY